MDTSEPQINLINKRLGSLAVLKLTFYLHDGHVFWPCEQLTGYQCKCPENVCCPTVIMSPVIVVFKYYVCSSVCVCRTLIYVLHVTGRTVMSTKWRNLVLELWKRTTRIHVKQESSQFRNAFNHLSMHVNAEI